MLCARDNKVGGNEFHRRQKQRKNSREKLYIY